MNVLGKIIGTALAAIVSLAVVAIVVGGLTWAAVEIWQAVLGG